MAISPERRCLCLYANPEPENPEAILCTISQPAGKLRIDLVCPTDGKVKDCNIPLLETTGQKPAKT